MNTGKQPALDLRPLHYFAAAGFAALLTFLHYTTMETDVSYHTLYRELYFVPIVYLSFRYGVTPGVITAFLVSLVYLPHVYMTWNAQPGVNVGNLMQVPIFLLVALVMGVLSNRERLRQRRLRRAEGTASLNRASRVLAGEFRAIAGGIRKAIEEIPEMQAESIALKEVVDKVSILEEALVHQGAAPVSRPTSLIEMDSILDRVDRSLLKEAEASGIAVKIRPAAFGCTIKTNEQDLLWVLEQVIKNAIDVSTAGSTVTVDSKRDEQRCIITVTDQGQGIAPENLPKIFIPFYTTKVHGTGLGLSVCKKIVQDNGGTIAVDSSPGEGTVFTLQFGNAFITGTAREKAAHARIALA